MLFKEFSVYLDKISSISSRNEIISVLSELFIKLDKNETDKAIYLLSGRVAPLFEDIEFNVGDNLVIKAISISEGVQIDQIKSTLNRVGDLGEVFATLKSQRTSEVTIEDIFNTLQDISQCKGKGAVEEKIRKMSECLKKMDPLQGKYFIKIILGDFRLGFSTKTMLDSLSWSIDGTKSHRADIERAYTYVSDLGLIAEILKESGLEGLKNISSRVGLPIFPKLVSAVKNAEEIIKRMGVAYVQPKYDGIRVQIHVWNDNGEKSVKIFSRNLVNMTEMFPEIVDAFKKLEVESGIFDGEAIGYNKESGRFLPFQQTIQRKRKYKVTSFSSEYPLTVFLFDLLFLDNKNFMGENFETRLSVLSEFLSTQEKVKEVIKLTETRVFSNPDLLYDYFKELIDENSEGIVAKDPRTSYLPGTRNYDWVKLKRANIKGVNDTFDTVVLGYYYGQGNRAKNGIGGILVGVYNKENDTYETLAKVGSGIKEDEWGTIKGKLDEIKVENQPENVTINSNLIPDVLVRPLIVCVIKADEITKSPIHTAARGENGNGFALRFPRLVEFGRIDKGPEDTTSISELTKLYKG